jgi:toxin ParE1/3/4
MARLAWDDRALDDIESIRRVIAADAPGRARTFINRIFTVVERLEACPRSGRMVPETGDASIRELMVKPYRNVYRLKGEGVLLVVVRHGG